MIHKIIVADDSPTIQKVIKVSFENSDYELIPCLTEEELEEKLDSTISLILLDYSFSEKKIGNELAEEIKNKFPDVSIMALLGTFDTVNEKNFQESSFSDRIVRPFETDKFLSKCNNLIQNGGIRIESSVSLEDDMVSGWGIESPMSENVAEEEDISKENEEASPANILNSELDEWGLGEEKVLSDITGSFNQFPPVLEEIITDNNDLDLENELIEESNVGSSSDLPLVLDEDDSIDLNESIYLELDEANETIESEDKLNLNEEVTSSLVEEKKDEEDRDNFWSVDEDLELEEVLDENKDLRKDACALNDEYVSFQTKSNETQVSSIDTLKESIEREMGPIVEKYVREYCSKEIEKVIWEIIPDLAENLIKKELKEISQSVLNTFSD